MERLRRRSIDGSPCKGADEAGSEEDRKDAEVLGGVVYGDTFVTRSERVLDERAEVVWQWHVLCSCMAGDDNEGTPVSTGWEFCTTCWRATPMIRSQGYRGIGAQSMGHPRRSYG